jgi:hypothetical protein
MPALEGAKQGFKRCNAGGKDLIAGFFHVREALQHKVDANGLFATELLVFEVCIMNHLGDLRNDRIVDCEPQAERLKSAQITLMAFLRPKQQGKGPVLAGS